MQRILSLPIALSLVLLPTGPSPAQPADSPWPMFRQNNQRTGRSDYGGPSFPGLVWSYVAPHQYGSSASLGADGEIYLGTTPGIYAFNSDGSLRWSCAASILQSSPAVGNGGRVHVGGVQHCFYALESDGSMGWSYETALGVSSSPAITALGRVYVGCNDNPAPARLL